MGFKSAFTVNFYSNFPAIKFEKNFFFQSRFCGSFQRRKKLDFKRYENERERSGEGTSLSSATRFGDLLDFGQLF